MSEGWAGARDAGWHRDDCGSAGGRIPDGQTALSRPSLLEEDIEGVRSYGLNTPLDGEVQAGLIFRVGVVDEPVTHRGITHLVEHVALTDFESEQIRWNGCVGLGLTMFFASGRPADLVGFFNHVTRNLAELPVDRVEHERRVLQVGRIPARSTMAPSRCGTASRALV